jgi:hypothetical protein
VRSGDYYLFEDLDEKVELDLLHERPSAGIDDAITDRKLSDKMTIEQVNFESDFNCGSQQIPCPIKIQSSSKITIPFLL